MKPEKNSRTTANRKNTRGGSPLVRYGEPPRQLKEDIYLEQEFTSYLQSKNLAPSSISHYVRELALFLAWIDTEEIQVTKPDVLNYLEYLKNKRSLENISRARVLNCLNHYYTFLYEQEQIGANPCMLLKIRGAKKKSLYRIYSPEELTALYDNFYNCYVRSYDDSHIPKNQRKQSALSKQRNAVILNLLVHQGVITKEIDRLELSDIDFTTATVKIRASKKGKERMLPLAATQIGILMDYLQRLRPQLLEYHKHDSEKLFLTLPEYSKQQTEVQTIMHTFKPLTVHLKSTDKNFVSFKQVRASVITHWIRNYGLRKTQVMAGHRQISTTEKYTANDLQQLTEDLNKLHPLR